MSSDCVGVDVVADVLFVLISLMAEMRITVKVMVLVVLMLTSLVVLVMLMFDVCKTFGLDNLVTLPEQWTFITAFECVWPYQFRSTL